jgi:hypothetical protein
MLPAGVGADVSVQPGFVIIMPSNRPRLETLSSLSGTGSSNPSPSSRQSVSLPQPLSKVENPAFRAGLRGSLGDRVGRDAGMF